MTTFFRSWFWCPIHNACSIRDLFTGNVKNRSIDPSIPSIDWCAYQRRIWNHRGWSGGNPDWSIIDRSKWGHCESCYSLYSLYGILLGSQDRQTHSQDDWYGDRVWFGQQDDWRFEQRKGHGWVSSLDKEIFMQSIHGSLYIKLAMSLLLTRPLDVSQSLDALSHVHETMMLWDLM